MNVVVPIEVNANVLTNSTVTRVQPDTGISEWSSLTTYSLGAFVKVAADGKIYESLTNSNLNVSPTTDVAAGTLGLGTNWRDYAEIETEWNSGTTYGLGDIVAVAADFKTYQSVQAGNLNNSPTTDLAGSKTGRGTFWKEYGVAEWDSATAYAIGDTVKVAADNQVYQAIASTTNNSPTTDTEDSTTGVGEYWQTLRPTVDFAMFDNVNGTQSSEFLTTTVRITPKEIVTSVAAFNVSGVSEINVKMVDPTDGEVYNEDVSMEDDFQVTDWWNYYFSDVTDINEFVLADLPTYPNAYIEITFNVSQGANYQGVWADLTGAATTAGGFSVAHNGSIWNLSNDLADITTSEPSELNPDWAIVGDSDVVLGTLIFGRVFQLGFSEYGTNIQLLDFSRKDTDAFGNFVITERRNSKLVDFEGYVETKRSSYLFRKLRELTTTPCVWYATGVSPNQDPTIVYGYYRDSRINISNPATSDVTLQIEGLI